MEAEAGRPGALVVEGWGAAPHVGIYAALFLVSAGLLTLEISLTRFFSYTVWYHLAYLTISMALLGFGSSGSIVAAFPQFFQRRGHTRVAAFLVAAAVLIVAALVLLARAPLDVTQVIRAPTRFAFELLGYYLGVGLPFLLAGFAISLPFSAYPHLMGRLYFADLLGAATGCLIAVGGIGILGVPGLVISAAGLLLAGAAVLGLGTPRGRWAVPGILVALAIVASSATLGERIPIEVTSSKRPPTKTVVEGEDSYARWTALNRVDAAGWERPTNIQYWASAGIDRRYRGLLPEVARITYDGCNGSNIYAYKGSFRDYAMLDHHLLRTPYLVSENPKVLVIGVGGGIDMMNAIKQGARHVTGAELQPETVYLLKERLRDFTGGFYDRPDVRLVASEGRHFIKKSDERYDLIQITAVDTFAAQATGAYVLAESYLYTTEAIQDYLAHLTEGGLVSLVVGDLIHPGALPPLASRLALTGRRALEALKVERPEAHLLVVGQEARKRNGSHPQHPGEATALLCARRSPGSAASPGARGSRSPTLPEKLPTAYPLSGLLGSDESARSAALDDAWFRIDAVRDRDPFFYNVGRWSNFARGAESLLHVPGLHGGPARASADDRPVCSCSGFLLIVLPLLRGAREGLRARRVVSFLGYFLALGLGFMFIEISFVQYFVLFLGSPTHALSVTIFSLLLFSSLGSLLSTRFCERPRATLRRLLPVLVALVTLYAFGLGPLFDALLHLEFWARLPIAVAMQLPLGLVLGMFMPLGVELISRENARLVPWAWGINGVGSVAGTTLAVVLAMAWGFTTVALVAAALYAAGVAGMLLAQPRTA